MCQALLEIMEPEISKIVEVETKKRTEIEAEKVRTEGEEMMLELIQKLLETQRSDEITRIKGDKDYRQKLYKEYGIYEP